MRIELFTQPITLVKLLVSLGWAKSNSEAKRLIDGDGICLNGVKVRDFTLLSVPPEGIILQKSRREFVNIQPSYGDDLWDTRDENGEFAIDKLVNEIICA